MTFNSFTLQTRSRIHSTFLSENSLALKPVKFMTYAILCKTSVLKTNTPPYSLVFPENFPFMVQYNSAVTVFQ